MAEPEGSFRAGLARLVRLVHDALVADVRVAALAHVRKVLRLPIEHLHMHACC